MELSLNQHFICTTKPAHMKVFKDTLEAAGIIRNTVVTTGSFDGVHIGHKTIIDRLNHLAREINGHSCLVTFHPHPRKVLYPDQKDLKLINSQEEKIELLSQTGLDNLVIIPFSVEFSKTSSHDFITKILIGHLDARVIIVGHNHHFGYNRSGDFSYLYDLSNKMGFKVEDIPLKDIENETVSSTKIRKALLEGNIMRANAYLDYQYIITGNITDNVSPVLSGARGRYFNMSIEEEEKLIPPKGIYATNLLVNGKMLKSMTVISETNGQPVIDFSLLYDKHNLEGEKGSILFYKKIKGSEIFYDFTIDNDEVIEAREDVDELIY